MNHKFALEHVGINCANPEEAAELAQLLSTLFNLNPRHGNKSEFGGDYFECMKTPFLGTNGHIAMRTDDLDGAVEELKQIDEVAYVRFASVYRQFSDIDTFMKELKQLLNNREQ